VLEALAAARDLGVPGRILAEFLAKAIEAGVDTAITLLQPLAPVIRRTLPDFFPELAAIFVPLGEPQRFRDWGWCGLPMDNQVDDDLVPTGFTETWVPLSLTGRVMELLERYFGDPRDEDEAYRRTGTFVWELYMAMPNRFWLSPSYTSGDDEWRDGAFRVNPYWFADTPAPPRASSPACGPSCGTTGSRSACTGASTSPPTGPAITAGSSSSPRSIRAGTTSCGCASNAIPAASS